MTVSRRVQVVANLSHEIEDTEANIVASHLNGDGDGFFNKYVDITTCLWHCSHARNGAAARDAV